jgi:hypothetical protein
MSVSELAIDLNAQTGRGLIRLAASGSHPAMLSLAVLVLIAGWIAQEAGRRHRFRDRRFG